MIDPNVWAQMEHNEAHGPLVVDMSGPRGNPELQAITHEQAEELRHVISIPVEKPPRVRPHFKLKLISNVSQADGLGYRLQFDALAFQVFNGTAGEVFITHDESIQNAAQAAMQDYDFVVPAYSFMVYVVDTHWFNYHLQAPGGGFTKQELVQITAVSFPLNPAFGSFPALF